MLKQKPLCYFLSIHVSCITLRYRLPRALIKVTGIRSMAPVHHLKISENKMSRFSVRKEIVENDNIWVVTSLSKVGENELIQTS